MLRGFGVLGFGGLGVWGGSGEGVRASGLGLGSYRGSQTCSRLLWISSSWCSCRNGPKGFWTFKYSTHIPTPRCGHAYIMLVLVFNRGRPACTASFRRASTLPFKVRGFVWNCCQTGLLSCRSLETGFKASRPPPMKGSNGKQHRSIL